MPDLHKRSLASPASGFLLGNWAGYRSRYDVANEVREATADRYGALNLRVLVLRRQLMHDEGALPDERLRGDLAANEFDIHLEPAAGQSRELRGVHQYTVERKSTRRQ